MRSTFRSRSWFRLTVDRRRGRVLLHVDEEKVVDSLSALQLRSSSNSNGANLFEWSALKHTIVMMRTTWDSIHALIVLEVR